MQTIEDYSLPGGRPSQKMRFRKHNGGPLHGNAFSLATDLSVAQDPLQEITIAPESLHTHTHTEGLSLLT